MADVVIRVVIQKAAAIAGDLLVQEASHFSKLKHEIVWIEREMRYIESYLEDADAKQDQSRLVATLVSDITGLGLDVEDILDKYFPEIGLPRRKGLFAGLRNAFHILGNVRTIHNFIEEVKEIRKRVNDINLRRQTYGIQENVGGNNEGASWHARQSFPHVDEPNVVGLNQHIQTLLGKLVDNDTHFSVISVVGMAGLGKTTLAKKVYNSAIQNFQCAAWIYVSQQPNVTKLLQDIARQVGLEDKKWKHNVEANLFAFLSQRRYLIVMDDIWQNEPWIGLKNGIPTNSNNGSRIILTSRNRNVGVSIGGESSIWKLQPLEQQDSRNLFLKMVGLTEQLEVTTGHLELENIVKKILRKCGGVPLAIVVAAGMLLLRKITVSAWNDVLMNMGEENQISKIFFLSFKDLPIELKPCFLYFGLFPEDYEIFTFDLINMWEAEGLIRSYGNQDIREVGEDFLNHLIARNLIQVDRRRFDGKVKSCRIHDIFHNLCVKVAKEINFFESIPENMARENFTISTRVQRVTTHNSIINYSFVDYKYEKLRTLMAFDNEEITTLNIKKLLRKSTFLKTLNLEFDFPRSGAFTSGYLESEIGNSSHLMYLRFVEPHSLIEFPYSISKLKNLQTFDARGCGHLCMSPYCLWEMMKHLKHVLLPPIKATDIRSCQEVLSVGFCICWLPNCTFQTEQISFENLETLWCCEASLLPNTSLLEFPKLKKLGLYFRLCNFSRVKEILNGLSHSNKLEILKLHGRRSYNPNQTCPLQVPNLSKFENLLRLHLGVRIDYLPDLPQNLIKLTLVSTQLGHNPLPSLERLPKLKILKMGEFSCSCSLYCFGGPSIFPQLQVLEIRPQDAGFSLCLEEEVMPRLEQLRLHFTLWHVKIPNRIKELLVWWEYAVIDKLIIKFIAGMRERMASNSITQIPSWYVCFDGLLV